MKNIIKSILFITWFFGTIISMLIFKNNLFIELLLFGQFFFILGIILLLIHKKNKQDNLLLFLPLIGINCIITSLLNKFADIDITKILPYQICSLFIIFGILNIIILKIHNTYLKKKCTEKILGEVVDVDISFFDNHKHSLPTYEIDYNGDKIRIKPDEYSSLDKYKIGQVDTLFINPSNPNEFIYPHKKDTIFTYIFSTLCVLGGIIPLLFILKIL